VSAGGTKSALRTTMRCNMREESCLAARKGVVGELSLKGVVGELSLTRCTGIDGDFGSSRQRTAPHKALLFLFLNGVSLISVTPLVTRRFPHAAGGSRGTPCVSAATLSRTIVAAPSSPSKLASSAPH